MSDTAARAARQGFTPPAAPLRSIGSLAEWLRGDEADAVTMICDPALTGQPATVGVRDRIRSAGITSRVVTLPINRDAEAIRSLAARLAPRELIVAIGGGSTLDFAKLTALSAVQPDMYRYLTAPQRSGFLLLPSHLGNSVRVLAVPTTLGTGSELGTVACFERAGHKLLVTGSCLRPIQAMWIAEATDTLPADLVADGVLEALFRTVSPYTGDPAPLPEQDAAVEDLAVRLIQAGDEVARLRAAGNPIPADLRLRIAEMSAQSQIGHLNIGRSPYAVKCWCIANELSTLLGLAKMRTVSAVWPVLWRHCLAGNDRLGSPNRIRSLWTVIRGTFPHVGQDPATGLERLMDAWAIERTVHAGTRQLAEATERIMRAWGAGLPILDGVRAQEIRRLLTDATHPTADGVVPPPGTVGPPDHRTHTAPDRVHAEDHTIRAHQA
ncbi:daptide-type RiPP biosynthesis dehydogenase [Streptomyces sp. NPDC021098]|uniref:daptide-type RiPP biosynthesis dehydogenase n=1 Tax=unclassified Streptomyces TaxID=2593676 RepID=UPI0037AFB083